MFRTFAHSFMVVCSTLHTSSLSITYKIFGLRMGLCTAVHFESPRRIQIRNTVVLMRGSGSGFVSKCYRSVTPVKPHYGNFLSVIPIYYAFRGGGGGRGGNDCEGKKSQTTSYRSMLIIIFILQGQRLIVTLCTLNIITEYFIRQTV